MKCEKCNNEIKIKNVKFCPFCGTPIEEKVVLAKYNRAQFFSITGDGEFKQYWEEIRNMTADEVLLWLREHPPVHDAYKIFGEWEKNCDRRTYTYKKCISLKSVKKINRIGNVSIKKCKLTIGDLLNYLGDNVFLTEEECEKAILKEVNRKDED